MPPTIPVINPANKGAPEARAMPKQSGKATKNTTILAGISRFKFFFIKYFFTSKLAALEFPLSIKYVLNFDN